MPVYEYRCRTCDERFEERRPLSEADLPATCTAGHADSRRLLSVFAAAAGRSVPTGGGGPAGGGCCGGGCGCG